MTLPLIRALAVGTPEEASVIRHAVAGGGLTDFAPVVAALHRTGALAYARERAQAESDAAAACHRRAAAVAGRVQSATIIDFRGATHVLISRAPLQQSCRIRGVA